MERLVQRDYIAILDFLKELYAPTVLSKFPDRLIDGLDRLIPSDMVTYNEMNPDRHLSADTSNRPDVTSSKSVLECWREVMHEHPVLMHTRRTGDLSAHRVSDFYSQREYRRRALYQEFFRKFSVEDVLCKAIRASGAVVIGCSFSRDRRSFVGKNCLMLDLIGPHLKNAWRNARVMSRLQWQRKVADRAAEALNCGVVALDNGGRVTFMSPWTRNVLNEFFGPSSAGDHRLPDALSRWVSDQKKQFTRDHLPCPLDPYVVPLDQSRLVVRLLLDTVHDLLLLQVQHFGIEPTRLKELGLTPRETEVLTWVAKGKTNDEIGAILGASPRTIQKHLERIFNKLGVETRTAAAAVALR